MEVMEEYLNSRISALCDKIKSFDEERKAILLEIKSLKNNAMAPLGVRGIFQQSVGDLEEKLDNLVVVVQGNDKRETHSRDVWEHLGKK